MSAISLRQEGTWLPADVQTPISLFLGLVGERPGILLESAEVDGRLGRYSLIAWDFRLRLRLRDGKLDVSSRDARLNALERYTGQGFMEGMRGLLADLKVLPPEGFADVPPITRSLVGYFGYGLAGIFEPKLAKVLPPEEAEFCLVLPGRVVLFDHVKHRCLHLSLDEGKKAKIEYANIFAPMERPEIGKVVNRPDAEGYMDAVAACKDMIRAGECIQTVLSTQFSAPFSGNPFVVYRRLRQVNPSPYMFFMRLPRVTLLGSSPELLIRCRDGELTTCPIAGTRPRGKTAEHDDRLAEELLADPKERAEHVMLVDLGRNDLGRMAGPGTVNVEKFMAVERFSHVMHIVSYVTARLKAGLDALDVLQCAFPAGTLSGAPKVRAMEMIADLEERLPRGPYAGCIGWIGLDEGHVNLDMGITIRSLWIRDGMVTWQAGAGIVYDSDPAKEWMECQNKARVIAEVLAAKEDGDVFTY
ncbi:MAG: anthranilate synthase component I family protein [Solidesulfovibrio sp. DCME]|uniref:anthranilate synthase component I family protein n=1 Tax=Solidesulfovibrio sp. DCME TaxID=3447380 RepID=UPI003D14390C